VLQPAIELSEEGFPVSPVTAHYWDLCLFQITRQGGPGAKAFYTADGRAPKAGQIQKNPDLAQTFRSLAADGAQEGLPLS
jgi:gamma-glutamyltranspeptidase/glutathione hydrolase